MRQLVFTALICAALSVCGGGSSATDVPAPPPPLVNPLWGDDVRLTNAPAASLLSYNFASSIAVGADDAVHVVWYDSRDGESQIYYKRSLDGGNTWQADVRLVRDGTRREHPAIAASGSMVYVAWHERRGTDLGFYVVAARSLDGGATLAGADHAHRYRQERAPVDRRRRRPRSSGSSRKRQREHRNRAHRVDRSRCHVEHANADLELALRVVGRQRHDKR